MNVDAELLAALADLARLSIAEDERDLFAHQLAAIISHIDQLQATNVDGIPPYRARAPVTVALRDDFASEPTDRAELLAGAPTVADGLVIVPRFVEE